MPLSGEKSDMLKMSIGYLLGSVFLVTILCFAIRSGRLEVMLCLSGGIAGWLAGILATPQDDEEAKVFPEYAKGIAAFLSGFVVARADKLAGEPRLTNNLVQQEIG